MSIFLFTLNAGFCAANAALYAIDTTRWFNLAVAVFCGLVAILVAVTGT